MIVRFIWLAAAFGLPLGAAAQDVSMSTKGRGVIFQNQLSVLDGRASAQYNSSARLQPNVTRTPEQIGAAIVPRFNGRYSGPYLAMARSAAQKHRVPEDLFLRLVQQESGWNAGARSHKGALGLAQLMPGTAQRLRVDPLVPAQNLDGGARYLRLQFERFGDWRLALAAYNAGPGAVEKYGGIPPYRETTNYVRIIAGG